MKLSYPKLIVILVIAIILRLFFVFEYPQFPVVKDAEEYDTYGLNVALGKGYVAEDGSPVITRSPGYPFFLAAIYRVFGHSYGYVKFFQILLSLFSLLFIFILSKGIFGNAIAFIATSLGAIYPPFLSYNGFLLSECLFTFCIISFLYFTWCAIEKKSMLFSFLAGLSIGYGALVREEALVFLPAYLLFSLLYLKKDLKRIIVLVLISICVIAPWTIRNYKVFNKFVLVSSQRGPILWLSSHKVERLEFRVDDPYLINLTKGLNGLEKDELLGKKGLENIRQHPVFYVKSCFKRLGRFWVGGHSNTFWNLQDSFTTYIHSKSFLKVAIKTALLVFNTLLVCFGFYGIFLANRKNPEKKREIIFLWLPIALITTVHFFLFSTLRYQVPIMPLVIIFAANSILYFKKIIVKF